MQPVPWEVHSVMDALARAGYKPYLVGGCVRDLLRGAAPSDYDLTSDARPEAVLELFGAAAHPTGLQHGTVTVVSGDRPVELTTMRRDGAYRDGRHPVSVLFTDSIEDDLARRDFTVNAMAMAADGTIHDPFGGRRDLRAHILRCVGAPRERFTEDALRILRALRFAAVLGFSIEPETAAAARAARQTLDLVARERVFAELDKLLQGEAVAQVLLDYPDVLGAVIPEITPCVGFEQRNPHHVHDVWGHTARSVGGVKNERALRWTMLFHDLGKPRCFTLDEQGVGHFYGHTAISRAMAGEIMERLRFEKTLRQIVDRQLECFDDLIAPTRLAMHKEMAKRGREATRLLLETKRADNGSKTEQAREETERLYALMRGCYDELNASGACCSVAELAVDGADITALGYEGAAVGAVLRRLLRETAAEKLDNTREAMMKRAERLWRSGFARGGK